MISKGKFLQNANFYLPVLQEYFPFFTFHSEGKLLYFIFSSFITLPLHQDIFLSYPRYKELVFQQSLLLLHNLQFSLQLLLRRITLPLILQYLPSDDFQCYTLLSVHSTFCLDFLRWFSIPFGVLASICIWRCQRYNWPLSEIFLNTGSSFSSLPAVAGVSSISP